MNNPSVEHALPNPFGDCVASVTFKKLPEDFLVIEEIGFEPSGSGEHAWLVVEKRGSNTPWVAEALAKFAGVKPMAVGFAGMKDRHAIARQIFTVHLPGRADPDWLSLANNEFKVLSATRHNRKLPKGALQGNRFEIRLRDVVGNREAIEARLTQIAAQGFPNYFGEQRFGHDHGNIENARAMFAGARVSKSQRGIYLSAARSTIFNAVLAQRVQDKTWNQAIAGEVFGLNGSGSIFGPEPLTEILQNRIAQKDIHPTAPMWGQGELRAIAAAKTLEMRIAEQHNELCQGLEKVGLRQERRATRALADGLTFEWENEATLNLSFSLQAGCYATAMMLCAFDY